MNREVYKEMCCEIYEGGDWDRMINCLERKDKEIERLNNIIDKAIGIANERINYCYQENDKEQLESWQEMFDILQGIDENE